jgi:hypothetical protein
MTPEQHRALENSFRRAYRLRQEDWMAMRRTRQEPHLAYSLWGGVPLHELSVYEAVRLGKWILAVRQHYRRGPCMKKAAARARELIRERGPS